MKTSGLLNICAIEMRETTQKDKTRVSLVEEVRSFTLSATFVHNSVCNAFGPFIVRYIPSTCLITEQKILLLKYVWVNDTIHVSCNWGNYYVIGCFRINVGCLKDGSGLLRVFDILAPLTLLSCLKSLRNKIDSPYHRTTNLMSKPLNQHRLSCQSMKIMSSTHAVITQTIYSLNNNEPNYFLQCMWW